MTSIKEIVNGNEEEYTQIIDMLESSNSIMFNLYEHERKDPEQDFLEWLKSSNATSIYEAFRREIILYYGMILWTSSSKSMMCIVPNSNLSDTYIDIISKYLEEFNIELQMEITIGKTVIKSTSSSAEFILLNSNELKTYRGSGAEIMIFEHFTSIHPDLVQPFLLMKDTRSFFVPSYESVEVPLKSQQP